MGQMGRKGVLEVKIRPCVYLKKILEGLLVARLNLYHVVLVVRQVEMSVMYI